MSYWQMYAGDGLKAEIVQQVKSPKRRHYFLKVADALADYSAEHDEYLTFQEFFKLYSQGEV